MLRTKETAVARRLLHHTPHVARENDVSLAGHLARFDEQEFAPTRRPRKARRHSGCQVALGVLGLVLLRSEDGLDMLWGRRVETSDPSASFTAVPRQTAAISRSMPRTPASCV